MSPKSWLKKAKLLVSPILPYCLFCGKQGQPSSEFPGICLNCQQGIPWIRHPRCLKCGRQVGCPDCSRSREQTPILCNRSAVAYTSEMREILGQYKYRGNERLAPILGLMLDKAYSILQEEQSEVRKSAMVSNTARASGNLFRAPERIHQQAMWQTDLLVPVPVSAARLSERGFNQAEQMADVLSRRRGIPQLPLLIRTQHTAKQSFKTRSERLADMKHVFKGNRDPEILDILNERLKPRAAQPRNHPLQVIIVDDIYTTGSTIRACAGALHQLMDTLGKPVEIYSLTWARS